MPRELTLQDVKSTVREIVFAAPDLSDLTRRRVKQHLSERLDVKPAILDASEWKESLKDIIAEAVAECQAEHDTAAISLASQRSNKSNNARSPVKPGVLSISDGEENEQPRGSRGSSSVVESDANASNHKRKEMALSDMSDLEDDEVQKPKKKRKHQSSPSSSNKRSGEAKKRASRKTGDGPDAEVKRLQSYVTACGVRKRWKNLFELGNCSGDSSIDYARQAKIVRGVLEELGMTGRLSMDRAKKIKEQREMEEELAAIGVTTAASAPAGKLRSGKRVTHRAAADSDAEKSEEDESEDEGPKARESKFSNDLAAFADELNSD